jgi:CubicO group peptidase (beta-lactamase class C family)
MMRATATNRLTRRAFTTAGVTALATASVSGIRWSTALAQPATPGVRPVTDWEQFDAALDAAMQTFDMVGAAVSVVTSDGIAYSNTFGARNLETGEPVTPDTHFLVASTTKSMTSLLVATFVDDGALAWDQPVREIFPDFRAPTDAMTRTLRVRDMLDMASGIGEPDAVSAFHQGDLTVGGLLGLVADLPVIGPPGAEFFYNGTVYSAGGYLPALAQGTAMDELGATYARLMEERVYRPSGMTTARIADDPRPFSDNYATGYAPDLTLGTDPQPYAPVGSYAPAGGTLATPAEMASYVTMQLNGGIAADGTRVVSAENLAECWASNVDVPFDAEANPDLERSGYGMGWLDFTYRGGHRFISHAGGIDGFTTFIAFLPDDDIGLVVNTNIGPFSRGLAFIQYVPALLLDTLFGLNRGSADSNAVLYQEAAQTLDDLAAQAGPVDESEIAPWLGYYERGWRLAFDDDGTLRLRQSSRAIPLLAMPDGSYVMASGVVPGAPLHLARDESGMPLLEIDGLETARWTAGGDA